MAAAVDRLPEEDRTAAPGIARTGTRTFLSTNLSDTNH
jgi:hypothetical protein